MRILLLSDLHIPTKLLGIPEKLLNQVSSFDSVIGLGDYVDLETVLTLKKISKQFFAVHGNMDYPDVKEYLPATLKLILGGYTIALCHGWGPPFGIKERILNLFDPRPNIILYGHTHQTDYSTFKDTIFINPGSLAESNSYAILELCDNRVKVEFGNVQKE